MNTYHIMPQEKAGENFAWIAEKWSTPQDFELEAASETSFKVCDFVIVKQEVDPLDSPIHMHVLLAIELRNADVATLQESDSTRISHYMAQMAHCNNMYDLLETIASLVTHWENLPGRYGQDVA